MKRITIVGLLLAFLALINWTDAAHAVPIRERPWCDNTPRAVDWQKRVAFEMSGKDWPSVLGWFANKTGLPFSSSFRLPGTFTFVPHEDRQKFSLAEILDILNETLRTEYQCLLLRDGNALRLVALPAR